MPNDQDDTKLPPPSGDSQRAEGYINQLMPLISDSKLRVTHTDLSKFDPSSLHDHYSLDLKDYQIEISHTKQPTTGRDPYDLLFNNLKNVSADHTEKEILAYLIISEEQFKKIKDISDEQIETLKKIDDEKRFKEAMTPVDELFSKIAKGEVDLSQKPQNVPSLPPENNKDQEENPTEPPTETQKPEENITDSGPLTDETPTDMFPAIAERPDPTEAQAEEIATAEVAAQSQKEPEPVSALAAAAAMPLPAEPPPPPPPTIASTTPSISAAPVVEEIPGEEHHGSTPSPAPTMSIEEVQKALKKAYEQSPQQPPPPEFRPGLGQVASAPESTPVVTPTQTPAMTSTINNIPAEGGFPPNPQMDQAIDQAFRPADNSVLAQGTKTPEV